LLWNLGVTFGVLGILVAGGTGFEALEMPRIAPPLLFLGFSAIGLCALISFYFRREPNLYPSHWFLLGGLFWFVWIYSASVLLLLYFPVRGVLQAVVDAWYVSNLSQLFFGAAGLGIIFYFVPKLLNRPLRTRTMAVFAFWTLAIFGPWTGLVLLIGGPIPSWMLSASIYANMMMIVPLLAVALILWSTLAGDNSKAFEPAALRFITFGARAYLVVSAINILFGLPMVARVTHLTWAEAGRNLFTLYGFVAMVVFGAIHYIVPRLTGLDWPSARLVQLHFRCSMIGAALIFGALLIGGIIQGFKMNLGLADFITLGKLNARFVGPATLGLLILLIGQAAFLKNLLTLLHRWGAPARKVVFDTIRGTP